MSFTTPEINIKFTTILCRNAFPPIDPAAGVSLRGAGFALAAAVTVAISTYAMSANEL